MENRISTINSGDSHSFIVCRNSQGIEVRATPLRLTRNLVVFEVYNPYSILQLSEVLSEFQIIMNERLLYSGRAIVSNLLNTGIVLVCEATLDESWLDVDLFSPINQRNKLQAEFEEFATELLKIRTVLPEFKVVVADMQTMLSDLRRWMEQVELGVRSVPSADRLPLEREILAELRKPMLSIVDSLFVRFEEAARQIQEDLQPVHRNYVKRKLHPLLLCSPFMYRIYQKPLGYAGDYEMVNMILRDPFEGSSLFAKALNLYILSQAPAEAHRNRVKQLTRKLIEETTRAVQSGRTAAILNLGCGPAKEVQDFLLWNEISDQARLTLLDFNDETLFHTESMLARIKLKSRRSTPVRTLKKSVHQILKEGGRSPDDGEKYDLIYCAGLFDYLSDRVCKRLMDIFYDLAAPGGLIIATNVEKANPIRNIMEYLFEWHLVYRDRVQFESLKPDLAPAGTVSMTSDSTGGNIFLEVRKPLPSV
jgi:extracellular factor (EF) 3-hydroxypalmitic acid methyl ester biosynthesis protein